MQPSSKPTRKEPLPVCYNCNHPKSPADPFCRNCGQKHTDLNDGIFHFVAEFITELLSLDGRVFRTLGMLFWRPGELTNEFMLGRRKRYLPPVQIYLFSTFLLFFALGSWAQPPENMLGDINIQRPDTSESKVDPKPDSESKVSSDASEQDQETEDSSADRPISERASDDAKSVGGESDSSDQDEPSGDTKAAEGAAASRTSETNDDGTIDVVLFNSKMKVNAEDFRNMANMSEEEIAERLRQENVEANPWLVTLLRNSSRLTTDLGVKNYYATLVAIASQVALVMLPLVAICLRILFFRSSKSLLQSFVLSSHLHTTTNLMLTPLLLLGVGGFWVVGIAAVCGGFHGFRSLRNVYGESWFWTLFKLGLITGGYVIVLLLGFAILGAVTLFLT